MKRREFITLLGGAAVAWPLAARAQQPARTPAYWHHRQFARLERLPARPARPWLSGRPEHCFRVPLCRRAAQSARVGRGRAGPPPGGPHRDVRHAADHRGQAGDDDDPHRYDWSWRSSGAGLVSSLTRPGGNITGNTILGPDVAGKRLQLLKEVIPSLSRVAFLWNPDNASHPAQLAELRVAVETLGIKLLPVAVGSPDEFDRAFAAMIRERADAFLMTNDPFHQLSIGRIIDFLANNRLPGMFLTREIVAAGGFMSYGASLPDLFRRGAVYVHKILQGTKPADLPVEQPVKFDLVVNLKTAKAIGLSIPKSFLLRAGEVID